MQSPMAREFSPELSSAYLAQLLNHIDTKEGQAEGNARREALAGGLEGTAEMGSKIGWARANAANEGLDVTNQFNLDVANKQYSERMADESRGFQAEQAQLNREEQERLSELGFEHSMALTKEEENYQDSGFWKGALTGGITSIASAGVGGYMGGLAAKK